MILASTLTIDLILTGDHVTNHLGSLLELDLAFAGGHVTNRLTSQLDVLLEFGATSGLSNSFGDDRDFQIILEFDADLTLDPAPVAPPVHYDETRMSFRRRSLTYPAPTLDSYGRPI